MISKRFATVLLGLGLLVLPLSFAHASGSVSIQSLSPGSSVLPGNEVTFSVVASGFSSALSYSVTDSLSGNSVSNSDFNNSGVFTWIPVAGDAGSHTLTVMVSDQNSNSATISQQITVQGPPTISIQSLSPGSSVSIGQTVFFNATASGGSGTITYALSDSFAGTSITNAAINSTGGFAWTPLAQDVGSHTITVIATDSSGTIVSASQAITVTASASVAIQSVLPGTSITQGQTLTFTAVPTGLTSPYYSVGDSYSGSTISSNNINTAGNFSWTPSSSELGTHTITVHAYDSTGASVSTGITVGVSAAVASTTTRAASGLSQTQIAAILSLLQNFGADQSVINNVSNALNGLPTTATNTTTTATNTGTGVYTYKFNNPLDVGATGADVTALQNRLTAEGVYSGPVTGYYGSLTQAAVKKYQGLHNLNQLGNVGPGTRAALNGN